MKDEILDICTVCCIHGYEILEVKKNKDEESLTLTIRLNRPEATTDDNNK